MLNRGGPISKLVSGTIGLAKEYKADSQERKAANQAAKNQPTPSHHNPVSAPSYTTGQHYQPAGAPAHQESQSIHDHQNGYDSADDDDLLLDLDEAQQELVPQHGSRFQENFDVDHMLQSFVQRHPPSYQQTGGLSSIVLLPQRRPKSQHKGFVRAYAPELQNCGIDQDSWLEFLDGFEKSINKSSWFHVTNAGVFVSGNVAALTMGISPALHMASTAIHVSIEAARRGYLNHQQNKYLDVMNEQYFKPRGLYCMVIKYEPSSDDIVQSVDMERNITQSIGAREDQSKWKGLMKNSSMKIEGDVGMPEPAELIFPELENARAEDSSTSSFKNFGRVMQDYKDRRAAAKLESENEGSKMPTAPRKEFASAYGDPNSTVNSGGFVSLLSKGKMSTLPGPGSKLAAKLTQRREKSQARRKEKKAKRPLSKMLKADTLYLMVTNLPSQEVLDSVAAQMQRAENGA